MRNIWNRNPTASPVAIGQFSGNSADGYKLFRDGSYYTQPNSLVKPSGGSSALTLDFGLGQSLTLDFGGFRSVSPPGEAP